MSHARARLRSAVPFRRAMIDRAELLALLAARFRRIRGSSDRENRKAPTRKIILIMALSLDAAETAQSLDRCGVSWRALRRYAGFPRRHATSIHTQIAQTRSTRRHRRVKAKLLTDEALADVQAIDPTFCFWLVAQATMLKLHGRSWRWIDVQIEPHTLQLLGPFAIEANVGRPVPIAIRSRKARALLAYLAMQPDYGQAPRTCDLVVGDCPDKLARHSLRQCLIALRQDLSVASEILVLDREAIGLHAQSVSVDARSFIALARSSEPDAPTQAAAAMAWSVSAGPDFGYQEFDTWHRQQADQLAAAAGEFRDAVAERRCQWRHQGGHCGGER